MKGIFKEIFNDVFETLEQELKSTNERKERNEKAAEVIKKLKEQINTPKTEKIEDNINSRKPVVKKTANFNEKYSTGKKEFKSVIEKKLEEGQGYKSLGNFSNNQQKSLDQRLEAYKASKRSKESSIRKNIEVENTESSSRVSNKTGILESLKDRDSAKKAFIHSIIFERKA